MKKQIIAAAVAATMTSVAIADIAITGTSKVNFTTKSFDGNNGGSNTVTTEHDLKITGKNGDTTVVIGLEMDEGDTHNTATAHTLTGNAQTITDGASGVHTTDVYLTSKVGDFAVKVGEWDNGNNFLRASTSGSNKLNVSTSVGPVGVSYDSGHGTAEDKITLSTDLQGVALKYSKQNNGTTGASESEIVASTSIAGVGVTYHLDNNDGADADKSSLELSGKVGDMGVKLVSIDVDASASADGDTWAGDFEGTTSGGYKRQAGADITAIELSTSIAGNGVRFIHTSVDGDGISGNEDADNNKIVVTRPLASGATFELTYTSQDVQGDAAESSDTLDLELAVSF